MFIEYNWQIAPFLLLVLVAVWSISLYKRKLRPNIMFVICLVFSASTAGMSWWYAQQAIHNLSSAAKLRTTVAFSPKQGATNLVIKTIQSANKYVYVAAFYLTSEPIADALAKAHDRGVDIKIVLDKSQLTHPSSKYVQLKSHGVQVRINKKYQRMHDKFLVIDDAIVETGSFNYTDSAENRNAENVLVIYQNHELAQEYLTAWQKLWDEAM